MSLVSKKKSELGELLISLKNPSLNDTANLPLLTQYIEKFLADKLIGSERSIIYQVEREDGIISSLSNNRRIEFSIRRGVAGYVARSSKIVRINNVLQDDRYDEQVDGSYTRNVLAFPIKVSLNMSFWFYPFPPSNI